jgi:hypothetical protein
MPNALETKTALKRVLLLGDTGSGKTTQFITLPGKKYMHIFDPAGLNSLQGHDVDYDEFLPTRIPAGMQSLKKETGGDVRKSRSQVYVDFEEQFNQRLESNFFAQYNWVGFDSITTLLDLMMDRLLTLNGRFGQWPHEDDWGPQMIAFTNFCRTVTASLGTNCFFTGHMQDKTNRKTGVTKRLPMMTGTLIQRIPLLFSDILGCDCDTDVKGKIVYRLCTVPNNDFTIIRTSIKGLEPIENVTIDFTQPVVGQGFGGIINWSDRQLNEK